MKHLITVLLLAFGMSFTMAQTTPKSKETVKKVKKTEMSAKKEEVKAKKVEKPVAGAKLKKDGTPDKRYKQNKHLKKDGTPDRRYKENK